MCKSEMGARCIICGLVIIYSLDVDVRCPSVLVAIEDWHLPMSLVVEFELEHIDAREKRRPNSPPFSDSLSSSYLEREKASLG